MKGKQYRRIGMAALAILLAAVLTACGSKAADSAQSAADGTAESAQTADSPQPSAASNAADDSQAGAAAGAEEWIVYTDPNGEVKIPKNPKRIVVLADSYIGDFLALGIKPVGVPTDAFDNPYYKGMMDGVEDIGDGTSASIEKILELKPDLIIDFNGTDYLGQLQKIAATVSIDYGKLTLREQLKEFGKMTNTSDKADAWIARWDQKIAESRPAVEAAVGDQTVSILNPYEKGIYAFGHNYGRGGEIIYGEFQLKAPPIIQKEAIDSGTGWASLSLEKLPEFAGDYIFTSPWSGDSADPENLYGSTLWKELPAVKNGRVFQLDPIGAYYNDPVSLEAQLDFIVKSLTRS